MSRRKLLRKLADFSCEWDSARGRGMTTASAMFVLLVAYQGTDLMIPARTSRARTSESRTAQLSNERRRFADVDIKACSKNRLCAKGSRVCDFSFSGKQATRDQRQQQ